MSWTEKVRQWRQPSAASTLAASFLGDHGRATARDVLLRNSAVLEDGDIADALLDVGTISTYRKGEKILKEGDAGNNVYFLLAGEVDVSFKKRKLAVRRSPTQVGEMAAIDPTRQRSATVICRADVVALEVPGADFRNLWERKSRFKQRLQVESMTRHVEQISANQLSREQYPIAWVLLSFCAALIGGGLTYWKIVPHDWTVAAQILISSALAFFIFMTVLMHNPAFFWKRWAGILLLTVVGSPFLNKFISFDASNILGSLSVDINSGGDGVDWVLMLFLILALVVCATMDWLQNRPASH